MKLNRNNADIDKLVNDKVVVKFTSSINELDFRKWFAKYGKVLCIDDVIISEEYPKIYYRVLKIKEEYSFDWENTDWYIDKGYKVFEWEIEEKQKTYTIKDVVENEGKIYKTTSNDCIYKYYKTDLYYKAKWKMPEPWRKTELTLREIIELEFIEYKPEPPKITFEVALKEMETKVCRCLFSNRFIAIDGSQFVDASNGEYTKLALPEIKGEWVVIEE